jgi:type I restriction enzyme S subunit
MDGLKPYAAYKESGLPWLGQVPAHWGMAPNRALLRRRKKLVGDRHANYRLLSLTKEGVIVRDVASGKGKFSSDPGTCQEVRHGELIFCLFDVAETPRTVGLSQHDGMITGAYTVFQCADPLLTSYLDLYYRALDDQKSLEPLYVGLRNTIPPTRFLGVKSLVPPREEQAAIVRFLDHATHRLDKAIRAKRKIIALLNEQKQAIIHRAVTRGLDPDAPLKDSGIPWLGKIPAHWDVALNQRIFRETIRSHQGQPETQLSLSQRTGLIATATMVERSLQTASFENWKLVLPDDLVLNRFKAHLGVFFAATLRGIVSFHYGVFTPKRGVVSKYYEMLYHTNPYKAIYAGRSNGMTVGLQNLSNQNFYNVRSPIPPRDEQLQIIDYVTSAIAEPEMVVSRVRREIALLAEYRTRLIADVVTGKLDVREAAARLPELAPETAEEVDGAEADETLDDLAEEAA